MALRSYTRIIDEHWLARRKVSIRGVSIIYDKIEIKNISSFDIYFKLTFVRNKIFKGTDQLCKAVELSMQCRGQIL